MRPKQSFPAWPWTLEDGKLGISSYGISTRGSKVSTNAPRPLPSTRPRTGGSATRARIAATLSSRSRSTAEVFIRPAFVARSGPRAGTMSRVHFELFELHLMLQRRSPWQPHASARGAGAGAAGAAWAPFAPLDLCAPPRCAPEALDFRAGVLLSLLDSAVASGAVPIGGSALGMGEGSASTAGGGVGGTAAWAAASMRASSWLVAATPIPTSIARPTAEPTAISRDLRFVRKAGDATSPGITLSTSRANAPSGGSPSGAGLTLLASSGAAMSALRIDETRVPFRVGCAGGGARVGSARLRELVQAEEHRALATRRRERRDVLVLDDLRREGLALREEVSLRAFIVPANDGGDAPRLERKPDVRFPSRRSRLRPVRRRGRGSVPAFGPCSPLARAWGPVRVRLRRGSHRVHVRGHGLDVTLAYAAAKRLSTQRVIDLELRLAARATKDHAKGMSKPLAALGRHPGAPEEQEPVYLSRTVRV